MYYLGIDPGLKGGFAVLHDSEIQTYQKFDKQQFLNVCFFLSKQQEKTRGCVEKVHAMPKQGAVSMFTFGEGYGWLKGVLDAFEISYQEIPPQTWKKEFGLNSKKELSIEVAKQLFPEANLVPHGSKKESDGIAESLLMSEYARRKL
jgi:crossover junction endodeoxyribonuclease RuvC